MSNTVEPLVWDKRYAVGVDRIDREHESLFNNYNVFIQSTQNTGDQTAVRFGIDLLSNYAANHFANEESVMRAANFPELHPHHLEHERFLAELDRLKRAYVAGEPVYENLCRFYRTWLTNHITLNDKKLSAYVYGLGG
jgi:hemerythrin-like metal-binding protein